MKNIPGIFHLDICGKNRELKVTIGLAEKIEQEIIKRPLIRLLKEVLSGEFYVTDLYRIFYYALLENKDTRLSYDQMAQGILDAGGASKFMGLYTEILTYSLTGGVESDGVSDKKK